jgi:CubicO group peptidase (beta-lactamase class C family)
MIDPIPTHTSIISRRTFCRTLAAVPLAALAADKPAVEDASLKAVLEPIQTQHNLPALAGGIVTSSGLQRAAVVGVRKTGTKVNATLQDFWHLGSDTKAMTASCVAMLVDEGKLHWDDTLGALFPAHRAALKASPLAGVTVKQLLHHTSGLPANLNWAAIAAKGGSLKAQRVAALLVAAGTPLLSEPGKAYLYSNSGYTLAGCVLEQVSAKTWEEFMKERLFKPLGMRTAGFGGTGTPGKLDQPWPHLENGTPTPGNGPAVDNPPVMGPAGTVHATLEDWAQFVADHLKGARGEKALLKPESYQALHTPELSDYAAGWLAVQRPWAGGIALTHSGDNTMNHCVVWIAPGKNFALLACTNRGGQAKALDAVMGAEIEWHTRNP